MAPFHLLLVGHLLLLSTLLKGTNSVEIEQEELLGFIDVLTSLIDDPTWGGMHPQPCTETPWPGVECEIDDTQNPPIFHITKIHIGPDIANPPCKSNAHFSKSLDKLPYLKTLSIFNCFTESPVSLSLTIFAKIVLSLEHLTLKSNPSLVGEVPPILGQGENLRVLCLSQNSLKGFIPKELGGLEKLEQLDLSYNNLNGQIPQNFSGLKSLSILDLSFNNFEGHIPACLGQLHLLQKLDLSSNHLNGSIPPSLGLLKNSVLLDLSNNHLKGPIPSSFSSLEHIEYLLLERNPINSKLPLFLGSLRELKTLSFSDCGLVGNIPTNLSSLRSLIALSLDKNNLSGTIPQILGSLPNLGELNLSQNQFSGELKLPQEFVYKLGKRLDVRGNKGLCKGEMSYMKNMSIYLAIPYCLDSTRSSDNGTFGIRMKPKGKGLFNGMSSSQSPWLPYFRLLSPIFAIFLVIFPT